MATSRTSRAGAEVRRRTLLAGGALTLTAATNAACTSAKSTVDIRPPVVPFYGPRQAGIETAAPANATFLALDLKAGTDRAALARLLRLLTDDAARLTQGVAPLADGQPELARTPARLTVTFGFGPGLFAAAGRPGPVQQLPAFTVDRLQPRWSGGDLLLQLCADDPLTVAHAQRMLVKDSRAFATVRWVQRGFRRGAGPQRNVLGQVDGTANPQPGTDAFARAVWNDDGGTTLVLRRIRAELETWDAVDTVGKEFAVGRRLSDGAPLTGRAEHDPLDLTAKNADGLPVISEFAHAARAHVTDDRLRIFRRPYNYDEAPGADGTPDAGLIFASFQRDVVRQFVPVQRRLDEADLLNEWITPIGSAVFAVPPGCGEGGWVGEGLLAA
ncbi:Dyp-type peroxidase [Dactylosporangium matsuzakiense]|nr:Dyp-type peroxidase [Dactylosporangium matsuzakiense]UWZ40967.1 Dyp-type peroxidase [Dactylosporangium matsuzakiense]